MNTNLRTVVGWALAVLAVGGMVLFAALCYAFTVGITPFVR